MSDGNGRYYFLMRNLNYTTILKNKFVTNLNDRYSGQCATGAQFLAGTVSKGVLYDAPSTRTWTQGPSVDKSTPLGTMIATGWIDEKYPSAPISAYKQGGTLDRQAMNHTGIFMGMAPDGKINIFDQYTGKALDISPFPSDGWHVVISDQKYDLRSSDSGVPAERIDAKPIEGNSTTKSCGR